MTQKYLMMATILFTTSTVHANAHPATVKMHVQQTAPELTDAQMSGGSGLLEQAERSVLTKSERPSRLISIIKATEKQNASQAPIEVAPSNAAIVSDKLIYGAPDAQFTITAYSDIECPICKKIHAHIKGVIDYAPSVVNWEYKHYPLSNHNPAAAVQSAMVNCALVEKGNKFAWFILDELVKHTGSKGRGQGDYAAFAHHVGVEPKWLERCVQSDVNQRAVANDYQQGISLGIRSTPVLIMTNNETGRSKRIDGFHSAEQIAKLLSTLR